MVYLERARGGNGVVEGRFVTATLQATPGTEVVTYDDRNPADHPQAQRQYRQQQVDAMVNLGALKKL